MLTMTNSDRQGYPLTMPLATWLRMAGDLNMSSVVEVLRAQKKKSR